MADLPKLRRETRVFLAKRSRCFMTQQKVETERAAVLDRWRNDKAAPAGAFGSLAGTLPCTLSSAMATSALHCADVWRHANHDGHVAAFVGTGRRFSVDAKIKSKLN
jgi:hypothetical protein